MSIGGPHEVLPSHGLVERHGHRTPAAVRQALSPSTGAAA